MKQLPAALLDWPLRRQDDSSEESLSEPADGAVAGVEWEEIRPDASVRSSSPIIGTRLWLHIKRAVLGYLVEKTRGSFLSLRRSLLRAKIELGEIDPSAVERDFARFIHSLDMDDVCLSPDCEECRKSSRSALN